jgi:hypothetical protein
MGRGRVRYEARLVRDLQTGMCRGSELKRETRWRRQRAFDRRGESDAFDQFTVKVNVAGVAVVLAASLPVAVIVTV